MGKQVIIMVLALVVIVSLIIANMSRKQSDAADELSESAYALHASHVANTYATIGLKELVANLDNDDLTIPVIKNKSFEDAIVNVTYDTSGSTSGTEVDETGATVETIDNSYTIISIATYHAPDGHTYEGKTEITYGYYSQTRTPFEIETDLKVGVNDLWLTFHKGGLAYHSPENSSDHNMYQDNGSIPPASAKKLYADDVAAASNTVVVKGPVPDGRVRLNSLEPISYNLNLVFEGTIRIDGSILVAPGVEVNIYVDGYILWGGAHSSTPLPYNIQANLYTSKTVSTDVNYFINILKMKKNEAPINNGSKEINESKQVTWTNGGKAKQLTEGITLEQFYETVDDDYVGAEEEEPEGPTNKTVRKVKNVREYPGKKIK